MLAMWRARQRPPPAPDALDPELNECKSPTPSIVAMRTHSVVSEESLGDQPRVLPSPETDVHALDEIKTPPPKRGRPTPLRSALDSATELDDLLKRQYRGKSPWAPPKPLQKDHFSQKSPCCSKGTPCYLYFNHEVERWRREFLYNSTENDEVTRARLAAHRDSSKLPCGKSYCVKFQSYWTGWHNEKIYGRKQNVGPPRTSHQSVKDVTVIAWFNIMKDCLEQMPDAPIYQLNAPLKKDVFNWYIEDTIRLPSIYPTVSESYFTKVWRENVPDVRLRRVLRFTKCKDCEQLREKRWDRKSSQVQRDEALTGLKNHYKFIKGERGYALTKAHRGVISPKEVLSIAQDGTSQLPNGVPQFAQALHGQEQAHNRLHHHLTLTMVHGMGT